MEKLNVAVADDNERMVEVLGQIIEEDKDLELVGKAHNGEEICNIIREKEPDVVVLDIIMPKMDGLAVMENCSFCCWPGTHYRRCVQPWGRLLYFEAF